MVLFLSLSLNRNYKKVFRIGNLNTHGINERSSFNQSKLATVNSFKADVSSVSPFPQRMEE